MLLPLVALLLQTSPPAAVPQPEARPVRLWLDADTPISRGRPVRVSVQTGADGNLVVLHRRTDGRIEVVFPGQPADDPFVRAGTYEIRGATDGAAFVVVEPDGQGMILAALSPDPMRFDDFAREASWNSDALIPTWTGSDAEGALSDLVQRMLGAGNFNYDVVTYTVAPPVYAQGLDMTPPYGYGTSPPVCLNCTFIAYEQILIAPSHLGGRRFHRDRPIDQGICGIHEPCAEAHQTHAIALVMRSPAGAVTLPSRARVTQPHRSPAGQPIEPRSRVPQNEAGRRSTGAAAAVPRAPISHVRYTVFSASPSAPALEQAGQRSALDGIELRRGAQTGSARRDPETVGLARVPPSTPGMQRGDAAAGQARTQPVTRVRSGAVAVAGGGGGAGAAGVAGTTRGIALPGAVWRGAADRAPVGRIPVRRR
ncbi:MAG TPA: DUF4384 domain-containing protein [Gemmatimonadales bacterium]|nr:DUF4384 domain-containing protein [Gemmatimonadales bacterium]